MSNWERKKMTKRILSSYANGERSLFGGVKTLLAGLKKNLSAKKQKQTAGIL